MLIVGNSASRLDLPNVDAGWIREVSRQLMGPDREEALTQGYSVTFAYNWPDVGTFDMHVTGTGTSPGPRRRPS